LSNR
jgi:IS5 family transposase